MDYFSLLLATLVSGLLLGGIYALFGVGMALIYGVINVINFAHGSFVMLGMYIAYTLFISYSMDPYLSIIISTPLIFMMGYLIQKHMIFRVLGGPRLTQLLLTMGILLILENVALLIWGPGARSVRVDYLAEPIRLGFISIGKGRLIAFLAAMLLAYLVYKFLYSTEYGKAIRAVAQDLDGARVVGINVSHMYAVAFGIACACASIAGTLISTFHYAHPFVASSFLLISLVVLVMGGLSSIKGAVISGLFIGVLESLGLSFLPGSAGQLVIFAVFVIVLLVKPQGLFQT